MTDHVWMDQAAPYALGVLDETDRASYDDHLATCDACTREVGELRQVAGLLALATPAVAPPPGLRDRIVADARTVRPLARAASVREAGPPPAHVAPHSQPRRRARSALPWLAAAAAVAFTTVLGQQLGGERAARRSAERALASTRSMLDSTGAALAERDSLIATLVAPEVQAVSVTGTGPNPSARYFLDRRRGRIVVAMSSLPPAAPGRTYQLWGIATGKPPVSLGTFDTDSSGRALASLAVPAGLSIAVTAVTDEPAGGSPQPTTTPFLAATW